MRILIAVSATSAGWLESTTSRRAGARDAPAVADILIRSRRAAVGTIPPAVHSDTEIRGWISGVVIPEREVWLTENDDRRPLTILVLDDGWIDQLYVDPAVTGRGLGSQLIDLAKARRPDGLQLWTFASNIGAQRFYRRHGFTAAETTDGSGNEENAPDIRFVWTSA